MSCHHYDWKQQIQQCLEAVPNYSTAYFAALCNGDCQVEFKSAEVTMKVTDDYS
jgi:hypothetical protein